jgi:hypothetical protein
MKDQTYISVNVAQKALILLSAIRMYKCYRIDNIERLALTTFSMDRNECEAALDFAKQCSWITIEQNQIEFTENGDKICNQFSGNLENCNKQLWMDILRLYITECKPAWAAYLPKGRRMAYKSMRVVQQQCFDEFNLIDSDEDDVVDWWDQLAAAERGKEDTEHGKTGRIGERHTMRYEESRTGRKPDWISLDDNCEGYDIKSWKSKQSQDRILIEVKTSTQPIEGAKLFLSRNEWDTAIRNNIQRYWFYLWSLHDEKKYLAIVSVEEMEAHIPIDRAGGAGKWENVEIPFSAFSSKFMPVD